MAKKAPNSDDAKKTVCPITKDEFLKHAKPLTITVEGRAMSVSPKEFSTGSFGYYLSDKFPIKVGEVEIRIQVGLNMTVIGSKPEKK